MENQMSRTRFMKDDGKLTPQLKLIRDDIISIEDPMFINAFKDAAIVAGIDLKNEETKEVMQSLLNAAFDVAVRIVLDLQERPEIIDGIAMECAKNILKAKKDKLT